MKKKMYIWRIFPVFPALMLAGCGGEGPVPGSPAERNRLVLRLFSSMERADAASAAVQAEKLRLLDPGNSYFSWIVEQQQCNLAVGQAQKLLDQGDFDAAEAVLTRAMRRFPLHRSLNRDRSRIRQLRELRQAVRAYQTAANQPEKERQLKIVEELAGLWHDPALSAAVAARKKTPSAVPAGR